MHKIKRKSRYTLTFLPLKLVGLNSEIILPETIRGANENLAVYRTQRTNISYISFRKIPDNEYEIKLRDFYCFDGAIKFHKVKGEK